MACSCFQDALWGAFEKRQRNLTSQGCHRSSEHQRLKICLQAWETKRRLMIRRDIRHVPPWPENELDLMSKDSTNINTIQIYFIIKCCKSLVQFQDRMLLDFEKLLLVLLLIQNGAFNCLMWGICWSLQTNSVMYQQYASLYDLCLSVKCSIGMLKKP